MDCVVLLMILPFIEARKFCEKEKLPLEEGTWRNDLQHLDSTVVENKAVSLNEGQVYVYENFFPNFTIRYIHVDNLAIRTCGASASIKSGGVGSAGVLIILHADAFQEIRSVVDIWGTKNYEEKKTPRKRLSPPQKFQNMKSLYLFRDYPIVSHNNNVKTKPPNTMRTVY